MQEPSGARVLITQHDNIDFCLLAAGSSGNYSVNDCKYWLITDVVTFSVQIKEESDIGHEVMEDVQQRERHT